MPDWIVFPLLGVLWAPVLVLLHELGHAIAAIALTDGDAAGRIGRHGRPRHGHPAEDIG